MRGERLVPTSLSSDRDSPQRQNHLSIRWLAKHRGRLEDAEVNQLVKTLHQFGRVLAGKNLITHGAASRIDAGQNDHRLVPGIKVNRGEFLDPGRRCKLQWNIRDIRD